MKKLFIFSVLCLFMAFGIAPRAYAQYDPCAIASLPFTEDFESTSSGIPTCYNLNPLGIYPANNLLYPSMGTYRPHSGTNALRAFNNAYTDTAAQVPTLILPPVDETFSMSDMVLEFWAQTVFIASPYFVVGVMDSPSDFSTFTAVQTIPSSAADTYVKYTVYFSNYTGTGHYIAIKFANTPGVFGSVVLDDITLDLAPSCSPAKYLAVDNIFDADVTINWQPNTLGGTTMYNIRLVNLDDESEIYATTTDTTYTFPNLSYSSNYRAFVTVVCLDGQESAADSVDFTTPKQPVSFPYSEDFEGEAATVLAPFTFSGTGVNQWVFGTVAGMSDPDAEPGTAMHSIYVSPDSGATNIYQNSVSDAYAVFNIAFPTDDIEYHLSFDYRVEGEASDWMEYDYLKVYMLDAGATIPATGEPSGTALLHNLGDVANHPNWTHFDVILNNVSGTAKQIVFYWYNNGWDLYGDSHLAAAIDNISLYGNDCIQPGNLTASDIATDGATLSWTNGAEDQTAWQICLNGDEENLIMANSNPFTITGLTVSAQYTVKVRAYCSENDQSGWSDEVNFDTKCEALVVDAANPFFEDFEGTTFPPACWNTIDLSPYQWSSNGLLTEYIHSGVISASSGHYGDVYLVMPDIKLKAGADHAQLTFWTLNDWVDYFVAGNNSVVLLDGEEETVLWMPEEVAEEWEEITIDLTAYLGQTISIAFKYAGDSGNAFYVDDVKVEVESASTCTVALDTVEGFEAYTNSEEYWTGRELPDCWAIPYHFKTGPDTVAMIYRYFATEEEGHYTLRMQHRGIVAMPALPEDVDLSHLKLNMKVRQSKSYYKLQVGVMTDLNGDSTFVPVALCDNPTTAMTDFECNFASYVAPENYTGPFYVAFKNIGTSSSDSHSVNYLDEVKLSYSDDCAITELVHNEDFEEVSYAEDGRMVPPCWTLPEVYNNTPTKYKPQLYKGFATNGIYSLRMRDLCTYVMPEYAVANTPIQDVKMTFSLRQPNKNYRLEVGVMTNPNDTSTFVLVQRINNHTTGIENVEVSFANYVTPEDAENLYIAFRNVGYSAAWTYSYNYIDSIVITTANASTNNNKIAEAEGDNAFDVDRYLEDITVYPNPTTGNLHIDAVDIQKVEVFNQMGQLVGLYGSEQTIDMGRLAQGVYMIHITVPQGTTVRKVVKR